MHHIIIIMLNRTEQNNNPFFGGETDDGGHVRAERTRAGGCSNARDTHPEKRDFAKISQKNLPPLKLSTFSHTKISRKNRGFSATFSPNSRLCIPTAEIFHRPHDTMKPHNKLLLGVIGTSIILFVLLLILIFSLPRPQKSLFEQAGEAARHIEEDFRRGYEK